MMISCLALVASSRTEAYEANNNSNNQRESAPQQPPVNSPASEANSQQQQGSIVDLLRLRPSVDEFGHSFNLLPSSSIATTFYRPTTTQQQQADQTERIRQALNRFMSANVVGRMQLAQQQPEVRIRTRSAPSQSAVNEQEISQWFDTSLEEDERTGPVQTRDDQRSQQTSSSSGSSGLISSGHKTIRNIQPVFMRLPPRFGKRSVYQ